MFIYFQTPEVQSTPEEWSFYCAHSKILFFLGFDFINEMSTSDKKILFENNILRTGSLSGAMHAYKANKEIMMTPSGEDYVSEKIHQLFVKSPNIITQISSLVVSKFIELKVTNEEYVLLVMLFFCNPGKC